MKARDLERLLADKGVAASKMAAITRALRFNGDLEVRGRGANAPDLDPASAARILIAVAGSGKAVNAADRLKDLAPLRDHASGHSLLEAFTEVLEGGQLSRHLIEVRIGRNVRAASFIYKDKTIEFQRPSPRDYRARMRVDGVLPFALLQLVSTLIEFKESVPAPTGSLEPDDDA